MVTMRGAMICFVLLLVLPGCGDGEDGDGPGQAATLDLPEELHDRVEVFLSFRTQDNSAPLDLQVDPANCLDLAVLAVK